MAKKSMVLKQQAKPKFSSRAYNRCKICGRPHAYLRDLLPRAGLQGPDPGCPQGILVRKSDFKKEPVRVPFFML